MFLKNAKNVEGKTTLRSITVPEIRLTMHELTLRTSARNITPRPTQSDGNRNERGLPIERAVSGCANMYVVIDMTNPLRVFVVRKAQGGDTLWFSRGESALDYADKMRTRGRIVQVVLNEGKSLR